MENMTGLVWASKNSLWYKLLFWKNTFCFLKEMGNELSAWALIWKVFCAEFVHWCPSDTRMSQSLFHPSPASRRKVGQYSAWLKTCNKIVSRKKTFSESKGWEVRKLEMRWKKEAIPGGRGMEKEGLYKKLVENDEWLERRGLWARELAGAETRRSVWWVVWPLAKLFR